MNNKTFSSIIAEAEQKLKALRPVVKWDYNDAIHAQEECVSEYIEAQYTDTDVKCHKDTMYLDIDNLHLYIAEQSQSMYYFVELVPDELDLHDIAVDVQTIDGMEYVDALWLTDRVNREYLIQVLRKSIVEDEQSLDITNTWEDLMCLNGNIEFNQYIIDRLLRLN